MSRDEQKTGLFQLIILLVFVFAAVSLVLVLSIDEPIPEDPLSELELEVTDVVMAGGLWTNDSRPFGPTKGLTYLGLKVNVTNVGDDPIHTIVIPFVLVTPDENETEVLLNNVVDPRLKGGPFAESRVRILPGRSHEGWIGVPITNLSLVWTDAILRIPTDVEGQKAPEATFSIVGVDRLKGLSTRQTMVLKGLTVTDSYMGESPTQGHLLFVLEVEYVSLWPYQLWAPVGEFHLWTTNSWLERPDRVIWEGVPEGERRQISPGDNISVHLVFDLSYTSKFNKMVYSEDFHEYSRMPELTIPLDGVGITQKVNRQRMLIEIDDVRRTDRLGARWSREDTDFIIVDIHVENDWIANFQISRWNFTLETEEGEVAEALPGMADPFLHADTRNLTVLGSLSGLMIFQVPKDAVPASMIYDDYGVLTTKNIDPATISDERGRPRVVIEVLNLTMVNHVEWPPTMAGNKVLLVKLNVTNPWEEKVEWKLGNVTIMDANGSLVDDEPFNMWIEDCIDGGETLYQGDSVEGWFQIQVPEEWTPGILVYTDPVVDTVVDISGMEVYRPPDLLHLTVEINWYLITDRLVQDVGDEAHRFHIFNLTFNNTGSVPVSIYTGYCNPYAENGSIYNDRAMWFNFYNFPNVDLAPGETVVGMIAFIIPTGEIPALLEYRYGKDAHIPIDPANVTYLDFNSSISMVINDMYWTETIGNVSSFYSDNYLVINITITNGWVEPRDFDLHYFDLVDVTGHGTRYDKRSYDQLENRWEDVTLPAGSSATGLVAFDIYNGSDPDYLVFQTGPYDAMVDIDPGDIRNGSGAVCMYDGDSEEGSEGPPQYHRAAWRVPVRSVRPCPQGHPVQALSVKGPDKN